MDYDSIYGLKTEARQKLKKIQPVDLGQAARISGVDPTDLDILLLHLESLKRGKNKS
jgi:tRNA uridine 5-carboxymethylaminomethyl modification enzyme